MPTLRRRATLATLVLSLLAALPVPAGASPAPRAAAAPAVTPVLAPRWTIADRPSSVSDDFHVVQSVGDGALVVDGVAHFGPGYTSTTEPLGEVGQAAVLGNRFVYTYTDDAGTERWVSSNVDGTDRFVQPLTAQGFIRTGSIVLLPDGWLEARLVWNPAGGTWGVYRVTGTTTGAPKATLVTQIPTTVGDNASDIVGPRYSDQAAAFTLDGARSTVYRWEFPGSRVAAIGGLPAEPGVTEWKVGAVSGLSVTLFGAVLVAPASVVQHVSADGSVRTWRGEFGGFTDAVAFDMGDRLLWSGITGSSYNTRSWWTARPDSETVSTSPAPWFAEAGVVTRGTSSFTVDPTRGVVRLDAAHGVQDVVLAATDFSLRIGTADVAGGQVVWTDRSAVTDFGAEFTGPQWQAWARPLTGGGPGIERAVAADTREGMTALAGSSIYLIERGAPNRLIAVDASGARRPVDVGAVSSSYTALTAGGTGTLEVSRPGPDNPWSRHVTAVDLDGKSRSSAGYPLQVSDRWNLGHDWNAELEQHGLVAADRMGGSLRFLMTSETFPEAQRLYGSQVVWVTGDADGGATLHWTDLADPAQIIASAPADQFGAVDDITGRDGWFVVNGTGQDGEDLAQLFQFGIGTPRATIAGAVTEVPATADGISVVWVVAGPNGDRLVAAPVPTALPVPAAAGTFVPVTPTRLLDTRFADAPLSADETIEVPIAGQFDIPVSGVAAVVANVTVTDPSAEGNLSVHPTGKPRPTVSNLNFTPGRTVPNLVTVPLGADGSITVTNNSVGYSDVVVDIAGYYLAGTPTTPGSFLPVTPTRVADSRSGLGFDAALTRDQSRDLTVTGVGGVPASRVAAVVANITVTGPTAEGNLSVFPAGGAVPTVSNVNFVGGQTVANLVTVPVGASGRITVRNNSVGRTHVLVDIAGYYLAGTPTAPGAFVAVTPTRVADSRTGLGIRGKAASDEKVTLPLVGRAGIPATGAAAVVANLTVTEPTAPGNIAAYPGTDQPDVSNLNFARGQTVPNLVAVPLAADGSVTLANNSTGSSHLIVDVAGYFRGW